MCGRGCGRGGDQCRLRLIGVVFQESLVVCDLELLFGYGRRGTCEWEVEDFVVIVSRGLGSGHACGRVLGGAGR